ncbi:hypothetical protein D3C79_859610 [compost metagenome]
MAVVSVQIVDEGLQAGFIQPGHQNCPLFVLEETAIFLGDGGAFGGADTEHQKLRRLAAQGAADAQALRLTQRGADQQDPAIAQCGLFQQGQGLDHRQVGTLADFGHQRRLECIEQVAAGGQVVR